MQTVVVDELSDCMGEWEWWVVREMAICGSLRGTTSFAEPSIA